MQNGFSEDGYIVDQNHFSAYPYRTVTSDWNGCGWIAAYNLRHALGHDVHFDEVRAEMDGMFCLRVPGPTTVRVMKRYLARYLVPECHYAESKPADPAPLAGSRAGILRYWESRVPHFVTYVRQPDGKCRFLNVADGLEDFEDTMEHFLKTRCPGRLLAFYVEE